MSWSVDGKVHRTIYKEDLCDQLWPGRDAKVVLATLWDGGTGEPGTALWATGPTDWSQDTKQPDYKVSVDSFSVRCGCENAVKPVRNGYQDMGCGFKPDTIDPFTNQPIKAQFPTVPKPPAGCWYPWWHPYNGTFNSWNPPGKALAPEPTTAATTAAAAATTATGVKGASTASVQPVSTALPSSPAAAATTAASNAAATTTASSAAPTGNSSAIALSSKPSGSVRAVQPWMAVAFSALLGAIAML